MAQESRINPALFCSAGPQSVATFLNHPDILSMMEGKNVPETQAGASFP